MTGKVHDEQSAIEELRRLLFGAEIEKLERLHERVEVAENFSDKVGEILPEAIIKSAEHSERLSQAMVPTVEEIVKLSIKRDINKFADALFPVIGPAIRKSISEAFRQMMQSLNQTIEQSFTWQGMKWRMESKRTGVPIAQIALLQGLVYRVEQAFLIHRETGLLLKHVDQDGSDNQNADMVSSMLSAIKDFVGDSFDVDSSHSLGRVEVGEFSIWIEQGPDSILAIVIRGEAPNSLRTLQQQTLEKMQADFGDSLRNFDGDTAAFEASDLILRDCMQAQYKAGKGDKKAKSLTPILILVIVLILLIFWMGNSYFQMKLQDEYIAILKSEPGFVITEISEEDGKLLISGLRDPLARSVEEIYRASVLADEPVVHRFQLFQSLQPEFTNQRILQRTIKVLQPPKNVSLVYHNKGLKILGQASDSWRKSVEARLPLIEGIDSYDLSQLQNLYKSTQAEEYIAALKKEPGYVVTEVTEENGVLVISGLRDPLARSIEEIHQASILAGQQIEHRFQPYLSLQAEFIKPRILQRLNKVLQPPATVSLNYDSDGLTISGRASDAWRASVEVKLLLLEGLGSYDLSQLQTQFSPDQLSAPDGVRFQFDAGVLTVEGQAEQDWIDSFPALVKSYDQVTAIDTRGLVNLTEVVLVDEIEKLESFVVLFKASTADHGDGLENKEIIVSAKKIIALAEKLSRSVTIVVRGYSDTVGLFANNQRLSINRAQFVAQELARTGVPAKQLEIAGLQAPVEKETSEAERSYNRRVNFEVVIE